MVYSKEPSTRARPLLIILTVLMVLQALPAGTGLGDTLSTFSDGASQVTLDFADAGSNADKGVTLPFDSEVTAATVVVGSAPHTNGDTDYPLAPSLDVGGDGDVEWAFEGTGYGAMGHQTMLDDGSDSLSLSAVRPDHNDSMSLILPKGATISSASVDIEGQAGYETWSEISVTRQNLAEEMGHSAVGLGDINGDGYDDIGVSGRGKVFIFFGHFASINTTPDKILNIGAGPNVLTPVGDVNGDGNDDILIGTGVHFGGDTVNLTADVALTGYTDGNFDPPTSHSADIDKDGFSDIIIGACGSGIGYYGAAFLYKGGQSMDGTPDIRFDNPTATKGQGYGCAVTHAGDLNGDGWQDIAIGATAAGASNEGRVYIYHGAQSWDNTSDLTLSGDLDGGAYPYYGASLDGGEDLDGDGKDDLVVGAPQDDTNGTNAGKVYVYYGGASMDTDEDLEMFGSGDNANLGSVMDLMGDVDGDDKPDLLLVDGPMFGSRTIHVYFGGNGMDNSSDWTKTRNDQYYTYAKSASGTGDIIGLGMSSIVVGSPMEMMERYGKMFVYNIEDMPECEVKLEVGGSGGGGELAWNATGLYTGPSTADIATPLTTALGAATGAGDAYGNLMADIPLNLTVVNGTLTVANITIEYSYEVGTADLASEMNDALAGATGPGDVLVPFDVTVSSAGKVVLKDLDVTFTPNEPPVAFIDGISPDPVRVGSDVAFEGHGTDSDGTIAAYRWSSDKMGLLTLEQDPTLNNLTIGTHVISFEVMDDKGRWSDPVTDDIVVLKLNVPPSVTILKPTAGAEVTGVVNVSGTSLDLDDDPLGVQVQFDGGDWLDATGSAQWTIAWDTRTVADGAHTIGAKAWDGNDTSQVVSVDVTVNNTVIGDQTVDFEVTAPSGKTAGPAAIVAYDFTIRNTGALADTYSLSAASQSGWEVHLSKVTLDLDPGKTGTVRVTLTTPDTVSDGFEELTLTVASAKNASLVKEVAVTTVVTGVDEVVLGVEVQAPAESYAAPGDLVEMTFKVWNKGNVPDEFVIAASTASGWTVEVPDLGPGDVLGYLADNETFDLAVRVHVPAATVGPLSENVSLKATSVMDPLVAGGAHTLINIGEVDAELTVPENQTAGTGKTVVYQFNLTNTGDLRATFAVQVTSERGWNISATVTALTLEPGETGSIEVTVVIPKKVVKKEREDRLTVRVTTDANPAIDLSGEVTTTAKLKPKKADGVIPGYTTEAVVATFGLASIIAFFRRGRRGRID